ncbi:MAG TPA: PBP1A family penicillin-binding protein, partial [Terriglobales bacterium]|nr:PBP1A family penicillin-binding protein [Terriglobales bacterium]
MKYLYEELPAVEVAGTKLVGRMLFGLLVLGSALIGACVGLLIVYSTDLPEISELENYRPSAITEIYDDKGREVGSFAIQRRVIVTYDQLPKTLRDALLSTEDKDFEQHWGINIWRVVGALYRDISSHHTAQGASTLTMQLSRNLFLSPERTLSRKIQESMLSIQIERRFTKPQIFTMYCNQIYLGHGMYGFEAGAQYYFDKHARDLTLDEAAVLAGLPKSPSEFDPVTRPERALLRRNTVINSLLEDGKITAAEATRLKALPIKLNISIPSNNLSPWFVEEIRRYLEHKYGSDQVHMGGLRVYTSLDMDLQKTANQAVLDGLAAYERRHGWKGKLENVLEPGQSLEGYHDPDWDNPVEAGSYEHALVTAVAPNSATVKFAGYTANLTPADAAWTGKRNLTQLLKPGDVAYIKVAVLGSDGRATVSLQQDSGAQGALLAIDNATGDIKAMVGGRDYARSKFNRSTQALRQVGSSFKPYVYTAAVDSIGASPDDLILDTPTTFMTASGPYTPHNYDNKFEGNITLRHALAESRNIPALKMAERVGMHTVIDYARKFGVTSPLLPYLPVALGAAEITLYEQTSAFSTFPNDGVRALPRYIRKVTDYDGRVLEENYPEVKDVVSANTARVLTSMLREVVLHGTAAKAGATLKYALAGKTGTTNDFTDAWFMGFSPSITCGVWIGYDEKRSLGPKETGAEAALPIWMDYMKVALVGHEKEDFTPPNEPPKNPNAVAQKEDTPEVKPG